MQLSLRFAAAVAGWSVAFTSLAAWGEEPKACQCPEAGVPILSSLPYLSRCFKNIGVRHEADCPLACHAGECVQTPCAQQLERIGVDFEWHATCPDNPLLRFGPIELAVCSEDENCCCRDKECPVACAGCACPSAGKVVVFQAAASDDAAVCAAHCAAAACTAKQTAAVNCCEGKCGSECCSCKSGCCTLAKTAACQRTGRDELWKHLVEMAAEKGAAEAALEARQEHSELLDALVEMATKSAALEAKLEAQAQHHQVIERMVELASENAQLKARVELAEVKAAMLKETIPLAVEKELLARRVAELEERLAATGGEEVRTAKKASTKKAR